MENTPGVVPLEKIEPSAIIIYGKLIAVEPGSKLEQVISEGPDALKKYIASGAIEELHDVMPHEDDTDYLNAEYLDDDSLPCAAAASDVQLPAPLPSSKMAQQVAQQNQMNMATQLQNLQNQGLTLNLDPSNKGGEKQRRSRFSDLDDDGQRNADTDLRILPGYQPPHLLGIFGNKNSNSDMDMRISGGMGGRKSSQGNQDVDMRTHDEIMDDESNHDYDSPEYRNSYFEANNGFRPQFGEGDGPNFPNNQQMRPPQWQQHQHQNNGGPSGYQMNENFNPRQNFMPNQNGPFPPFQQQQQSHGGGGNFRGDFRGPPPFGGGNNFNRPDGPGGPPGHWNNGMGHPDGGFRGRGNFGGPMRGPMRGGPRPRFPGPGGPRGPWGPPPRRDGPNNSMRGRNVF